MGTFYIINSERKLDYCREDLKKLFDEHHWLMIDIHLDKRSLSANAISHVWYGQIGEFLGESTMYARCYCKLMFGVPIAREDPKNSAFYEFLNFDAWDYEKQLGAMKHLAVSRKFNTADMKRYLAAIQQHFAQEGLVLEGKDATKVNRANTGR